MQKRRTFDDDVNVQQKLDSQADRQKGGHTDGLTDGQTDDSEWVSDQTVLWLADWWVSEEVSEWVS